MTTTPGASAESPPCDVYDDGHRFTEDIGAKRGVPYRACACGWCLPATMLRPDDGAWADD